MIRGLPGSDSDIQILQRSRQLPMRLCRCTQIFWIATLVYYGSESDRPITWRPTYVQGADSFEVRIQYTCKNTNSCHENTNGRPNNITIVGARCERIAAPQCTQCYRITTSEVDLGTSLSQTQMYLIQNRLLWGIEWSQAVVSFWFADGCNRKR